MSDKKKYDESDIQSLQGLSGVRKKPTVYIGPADANGLWTILREATDNTVDEALAGRNNYCLVSLSSDGSFVVADKGEGIPVKEITVEDSVAHKKHRLSAFRGVISLIHTGAKMGGSKAYSASRGTHGIGIKATNALSKSFAAYTFRDGKWYWTKYAKGKMLVDVERCKAPKLHGIEFTEGTIIHFTPDEEIFGKHKFPIESLFDWSRTTSLLTPGFKIILRKGDKKKVYYEKDGPKTYLKERVEELKGNLLGQPIHHQSELADFAIAFTDYDGTDLKGFTNGLRNHDGGNHVNTAFKAIYKALEPYRGKRQKFGLNEIKQGVIGILNIKISAPSFDSQNKTKLVDERAKAPLGEVMLKALKKYFAENKATAARICEQCEKLLELHNNFVTSKAAAKKLNQIRSQGFPVKFATALRCKPEDRETYFVEGDSAGGTAKQARDKDFQEVLPLRGKIKNSIRDAKGAMDSAEVVNIFAACGFNPKKTDPMANPRQGKVILLMDPDPDGGHIESLVLSCIYRFMPTLFSQGRVFVVDSPEYFAKDKQGKCYTAKTLEKLQEAAPKGAPITHIKGWGELPPEDLEPLAMNPDTRKLIRIMPVQGKDKIKFVKLMGDDPETRKELLGV